MIRSLSSRSAGRILLLPPVGSIRGRILDAVRRPGGNDRGQLDLRYGPILRRYQGHDRLLARHLLASMLEIRSAALPYGTVSTSCYGDNPKPMFFDR